MNLDKSNWKRVKLGDVAFEYSKRVDKPSESGFDRFVGSANIGRFDFRVRSWESTSYVESSMKQFEAGDYLLVRRSLYASDFRERAPRADFDGICSGDILTIKENPEMIADGFLIGVLNSPKLWQYIVANASGSITRRIKWKELAQYEFLLPPKAEQARIAELLWAADEVVEKNTKLLQTAESTLFTIKNNSFTSRSYSSKKILEVAQVQRGRFSHRPRNAPQFFGGSIPFIQTSEVIEAETYIERHEKTLNEEGLKISKMFPKKTIVMVIAGTYVGSVGILKEDSAFTDSLVGIRSNHKHVTQEYLFNYLKHFEKQIDSLATEVARRNLSIDRFQDFAVFYPESKKTQEEIVDKINEARDNKKSIQKLIDQSKSLQTQLINQVFL